MKFAILVVGNEVMRVQERDAMPRYDFVFVTGGLGATHDDVTAEGIAKAIEKPRSQQ